MHHNPPNNTINQDSNHPNYNNLILREKERAKKRKTLKVLMIILIIVLLIVLIRVPKTIYSIKDTQVEQSVKFNNIELQEISDQVCGDVPYRFSYSWDGWNNDDLFVTPRFYLQNLENKGDIFNVTFAFFDSSKYPYNDYYARVPWDDVAFWSEKKTMFVNADTTLLISIPTRKRDPNKQYWASADVELPDIYRCSRNNTYEKVKVEKNIQIMCPSKEISTRRSWVPIWELFIE